MPELTVEWRSVAKEPPLAGETVIVWFKGRPAVGRYRPQGHGSGVHDWLIYPAGECPMSPFPQHQPKWWTAMIAAPSDEPVAWGPPTDFGEIHVVWRGSVTDLYTDLFPLLTPPQLAELGRKLIGQPGGHVARMAGVASSQQPAASPENCTHCQSPDGNCPWHRADTELLWRVRAALQRFGTPERKLLEVESVVFGTERPEPTMRASVEQWVPYLREALKLNDQLELARQLSNGTFGKTVTTASSECGDGEPCPFRASTVLSQLVDGRYSIVEMAHDLKGLLGGENHDMWKAFLHVMTKERQPPVPMLLRCPSCNERHFDEGEFATKPHHMHACQICGEVWRPAIVNTVGVHFLPGFKNERTAASEPLGSIERDMLIRVRELIDRVIPDTPAGFSCPVTKAECVEPCVGSECRLLKLRNAL